MDKVRLLKEQSMVFRNLLVEHKKNNSDAMLLLKLLTPLFQEIEDGKITPPKYYEFGNALGKDNPFYEPDKPFHNAESNFIAALEDWESQNWYRSQKNEQSGK